MSQIYLNTIPALSMAFHGTNRAIRDEIAFIRNMIAAIPETETDRISELEYLSEKELAELPADAFQTEDLKDLMWDISQSLDMLKYTSQKLMTLEGIDRKEEIQRLSVYQRIWLSWVK
tara:strand:+ start:1225 stop:1578 length:354 start_codon:yes stop_codon:yes gene_type:complete